jgi:Factor for inversion stimulation Fis, transcriptional activator|tara:strand:- start:218 stop:487 length:270 start_codon:yes stop_codon:yes gene_type:complete
LKNKKNSFDSYSKKPLKDEVRKAMNRYFNQLDQNNVPIDVYQLVLNEVEPPLLNSVMRFSNNNQSKAAKILGINRTTLRTKLKKYNIGQ